MNTKRIIREDGSRYRSLPLHRRVTIVKRLVVSRLKNSTVQRFHITMVDDDPLVFEEPVYPRAPYS